MVGLAFLTAIFVIAIFYGLYRVSHGGSSATKEDALRARLRTKVMGNEGAVERLVEAERRRRPEATNVELLTAAIQRLDRDRR